MVNLILTRIVVSLGASTILMFSMVTSAFSTSIEQLTFKQLAVQSEMVFDGEVIAVESSWNAARTSIATVVDFRINQIVSGSYPAETLTLSFMGGVVGETTMYVEAMQYPELGERGVYFVESTTVKMVNPLLGWSQGHFKVEKDQVKSAKGEPIESIDDSGSVASGTLSEGLAQGVKLKAKSSSHVAGLSLLEFKAQIKAASANSPVAE